MRQGDPPPLSLRRRPLGGADVILGSATVCSEATKGLLQSSRGHVQLAFDLAKFVCDLVVLVRVAGQLTQPRQEIFE